MRQPRGAYPAPRAAALSGVPLSTVHYWARTGLLRPSVSAQRVKLWSYTDLMGLRTIYWLRHGKTARDGVDVPRTAMPAVRQALHQLAELDLTLWSEDSGPGVAVDRAGDIVILAAPTAEAADRQRHLPLVERELLTVTEPFETSEGSRGPDLNTPRPRLRIVPGKLGGAPHVTHTRLESQALAALAASGLPESTIYALYPAISADAIDDALSLERQLDGNLGRRAA